jgi:hypothetical protein
MIATEAATMTMPSAGQDQARHDPCRAPATAQQGDGTRGQQQGDQDAEGAQEQACADQRARPSTVEQAAGQHADRQGAGRERCHDQARVQRGQAHDELQALGEEQFDADRGGHRQHGRDHPASRLRLRNREKSISG